MGKTEDVIHEYNEQKMDPYWWVVSFLALSVAFLFSLALVCIPLWLYFSYKSTWLLILLVFIPIGIWMGRKLYLTTKKLIWNNNHLSTYTLCKDSIYTNEWNDVFQPEPLKRTIALSSIHSVTASFYVARKIMSLRSNGGTGDTITEITPIIYIMYAENTNQNIITIPFSEKNPEIDHWLTYFEEKNIRLRYTDKLLYRKDIEGYLNDEIRLTYLKSDDNTIDFSFTGNWEKQARKLGVEWQKKQRSVEASE